jgi:hypothetical protein
VPLADRIATFDQDGTLWVEHPIYTQLVYCFDLVPALVKAKAELAKVEPFPRLARSPPNNFPNQSLLKGLKIGEQLLKGRLLILKKYDLRRPMGQPYGQYFRGWKA